MLLIRAASVAALFLLSSSAFFFPSSLLFLPPSLSFENLSQSDNIVYVVVTGIDGQSVFPDSFWKYHILHIRNKFKCSCSTTCFLPYIRIAYNIQSICICLLSDLNLNQVSEPWNMAYRNIFLPGWCSTILDEPVCKFI